MPLTVKICGLRGVDTLEAALVAGADMVGFVFFPPSPRHLGLEGARVLGEQVATRAKKVALTVDADDQLLSQIVAVLRPDMLQLHGKESLERVALVRSRFGLPVMKAVPIASRGDLGAVRQYTRVADRLIFDARAPQEATRPGGVGKPFDWTLLPGPDTKH